MIAFDAGATKGTPAARYDAWVIPAPLGGAPRKVVELGRALRWSPDGTQIAFVRPGSSAGDSLWVARSDGGSPREVAALRGAMHIHWPVWSHDGRYIYFNYSFSTANREPASIYRVAAEGGAVEPVVPTARRAVFAFPTPDGKGLIYSANPHGVDLALWWRPFDGSEPTRLTTGVGEFAEASMTADGQTLVSSLVQSRRALTLLSIAWERLDAGDHQWLDRRLRSDDVTRRHPAGLHLIAIGFSESLDVRPGWHDGSRADLG